jgi:hypothetical protein
VALDVRTGRGNTVTEVKVGGGTKVFSFKVGRPVSNVRTSSGDINNIIGVDTTTKQDGSVLVYNASSENFEATKTLEKQFINGGNF